MKIKRESYEIVSEEFAEYLEYGIADERINFQQTKAFGDLQEVLGHKVFYFVLDNSGFQAAILVTLTKIRFGYLAEAYGNPYFSEDLADNQYLIRSLKSFLKKRGVLKLVIHSNQMIEKYDDNWETIGKFNQDLTDFYAQIGLSESQLTDFEKGFHFNYSKNLADFEFLSQLEKSYKRKGLQTVKKARKLGIDIVEATFDELDDFKKVVDEAGERRDFQTRDLTYYQSVYKAYGNDVKFIFAKMNFQEALEANQLEIEEIKVAIDKAQVKNKMKSLDTLYQRLARADKLQLEFEKFVEKYGNKSVILSAAQFFIMPCEMTYMFSGMYDEFRDFSAQFLIQDEMLKFAFYEEIDTFHFLGVNAKDESDQGVLKFKQNFGGYIWESSGNYELIVKPILYKVTEILKTITKR
ncbi:peptidoglycan bridge formation glycyltransferase FemA/FemB family protein [Lactococcus hodotermopsidis]|uniref:peptidoglycan bridge formation glycyltransferase FemA/FemB family protein n=1 Tax=Pseudolactococcus hodotermopsidis TaxID=2709157 RepID=UPI001E4E938A|nr:peptidoglycan bridge formation glycyltransferase FemA/FemB family protein [Lactococcus hodotermopsidis]